MTRSKADLRRALEALLDSEVAERVLDEDRQIAWLIHHLGLYIGRLIGFADLAEVSISDLLSSDLALMVEAGADALGERLGHSRTSELTMTWNAFFNRVHAAPAVPHRVWISELARAFEEFRGAWREEYGSEQL